MILTSAPRRAARLALLAAPPYVMGSLAAIGTARLALDVKSM